MTTQIQTIDAQVAEIVTGSQLANANELVTAFLPIAKEAQEAIADSMMISVTSVDDKEGMKRAREARLRIRELRLRTEQARKSLKEDALRKGQAIDKVAGIIKDQIAPVEEALKAHEEFAERVEAARKAKIGTERAAKLRAVNTDPSVYPLDVMGEEAFANLLEGATLAHQKRLDDARKAEEARLAAEKARQEELAKERAEREKAQQAAREAAEQARKDREALEAAQRSEREARDAAAKAEREAKEAEERKAREQQRAAAAPDREKIAALATSVRAIRLPEMATPEGKTALRRITGMLDTLARSIDAVAASM